MNQLSNQMQAKMTMVLADLRSKTIARMTEAGERIKSRPAVDDSLNQIKSHHVMQKNEDGAILLNAAIGIPGLSAAADAAVDIGEQLFSDRKATYARSQDEIEYSPKQIAKIREQNQADLELFQNLDDKLNTLNTYIAQGYTLGLNMNGELVPWDEITTPKHDMKIDQKPELDSEFLPMMAAANRPFKPVHKLSA